MRHLIEREYATVADVREGLEGVERYCGELRDRRGVFATAYLQITCAIESAIEQGRFRDADWSSRYLVSFGNLYRSALLQWETGEIDSLPRSWKIAFEAARSGTGLV